MFSGSGACELAAVLCGIVPIWNSEIEKFPIEVTSKRFPSTKQLGDITKINGAEIDPVDIITFGSPCQNLSVAGKRDGLHGEQSSLFMEAIRIIKEMRNATNNEYPRYILWENVPGAFSTNKGYDFRTVLEEIAESEVPMPSSGKWATAGVVELPKRQLAWRVLDAQYWGVPQRRKRIFLVADFRGKRAREILFKPESMSGNITQSEESWKGITINFERSTGTSSRCEPQLVFEPRSHDGVPRIYSDVSPTLNTAQGGQRQPCVIQPNNLTDSKVYNITFCDANGQRKDRPNGGLYVNETDKASSITAKSPGCETIIVLNDQGGSSINVEKNGISPTLRSEAHGNLPIIAFACNHRDEIIILCDRHAISYTLSGFAQYQEGVGTLKACGGDLGGGSECSITSVAAVNCRDLYETDVCGTLMAKNSGGYSLNYQNPIRIGKTVRRLTPTECARLQGFPDWWCLDIQHSDTAEYKMWGNAMALPCVLYIMRNIVNQ